METKEAIVKDPSGGMSPGAIGFSGLREREMGTETDQVTDNRLPYVAPVIETHLVELEGGIAANSANVKSDQQWEVNEYENGGDQTLENITMF